VSWIGWIESVVVVIVGVAIAGAVFTALATRLAESAHPPIGARISVEGLRLHVVDRPGTDPGAIPIVFVHGASGNLRDLLFAFDDAFPRHRRIFVDRPGHGWSERGGRSLSSPLAQAGLVAELLEEAGIRRAVIVGHSWGGAVVAAFGVAHPEQAAALVFLAPASHPWPGGVDPLYRLAVRPLIGRLFAAIVVAPVGRWWMRRATAAVFAPDPVPADYGAWTGSALVLRPAEFRANAEDVVALEAAVRALAPSYPTIGAPTLIVTGDRDAVVWPSIHAEGLARDIAGARLVRLAGVGHMPQHAARATVIAEIDDLLARIARPGAGDAVAGIGSGDAAVRADEGDPQHVGRARGAERHAADHDDALTRSRPPLAMGDAAGAIDHVVDVAGVLGDDAVEAPDQGETAGHGR
jgi:pimeloyl-ACP methyl ester carboxylesterase